jgi:hypothetical protein
MQKKSLVLALGALLASAAVAYATVTFNPATGTGFVGKGDVQLAFGWNNAAAQRNARDVSFTYDVHTSYVATCTFTTGEGTRGERIHNIDHHKTVGVNAVVQYDARTHKQVDGFFLNGFGATTGESGEVPVVGAPCMGNEGHDGVWSAVEITSSGGGLYVNWNGNSVLLQ